MKNIVGITYNLKAEWQSIATDPVDASAEYDKPQTIEAIVKALESHDYEVVRIGNVHQLLKIIDNLNVDIVFNLCEGEKGRNRESQVPILLEMKGIPYIGADALSQGLTLDKIVAKKLFKSEGIPTARYFQAQSTDGLEELNTIGYPLIVKTRHEGSSKGISQKSKVNNLEELSRQVKLINQTYDQPALVEEFIRGTEYTVPVLGNKYPLAMPVVQVSIDGNVNLGEEFYTNERIYSTAVEYICPAQIDEKLCLYLQALAVKVFSCVECREFGRVDFRVDENNNPYVLEINPLPSLDLKDVFNIFPQLFGSDYAGVLDHVIKLGMERNGLIMDYEDSAHPFNRQLESV